MSYWTNKLVEENSLINKQCWYRVPYSGDLNVALIKEVKFTTTNKAKIVTCTLNNGVVAVLHNDYCPGYIGRDRVWGFLTIAECIEYWDI